MVNPSTLASAAGAAVRAVADLAAAPAGVAATLVASPAKANARPAAARPAAAPAKAQATRSSSTASTRRTSALPQLGRSVAGGVGPIGISRGTRLPIAGYATAARPPAPTSTAKSSSTSSRTSLSFLSDPKLSIDEKLMRLLAYLNDKYDKEMQAKMDEMAGKPPKASTSTSKSKSGGILGKVASAVSSVVGGDALKAVSGFLGSSGVKAAIGKLAGPVLAAGASALGFPMAAPLLLKYGSSIANVASGVVSKAASSSGSTSSTTASGTGPKDEQYSLMELQRLRDKQKEMFALVSNILKSGHDTRMAVINNLR